MSLVNDGACTTPTPAPNRPCASAGFIGRLYMNPEACRELLGFSGWKRSPSPLGRLGNYSLQQHGQWSVIIPGLLRVWLKTTDIQGLLPPRTSDRRPTNNIKRWKGGISQGAGRIREGTLRGDTLLGSLSELYRHYYHYRYHHSIHISMMRRR